MREVEDQVLEFVLVAILETRLLDFVELGERLRRRRLLVLGRGADAEVRLEDHRIGAPLHIDIVQSRLLQDLPWLILVNTVCLAEVGGTYAIKSVS